MCIGTSNKDAMNNVIRGIKNSYTVGVYQRLVSDCHQQAYGSTKLLLARTNGNVSFAWRHNYWEYSISD